jgi:hypothetical protein
MNNPLCLTVITLLLAASNLSAATHYVWQNSPGPAAPYTTWTSAAHVIQDAVDAAQTSDTVLVAGGVYATGGVSLDVDDVAEEIDQDRGEGRAPFPKDSVPDGGGGGSARVVPGYSGTDWAAASDNRDVRMKGNHVKTTATTEKVSSHGVEKCAERHKCQRRAPSARGKRRADHKTGSQIGGAGRILRKGSTPVVGKNPNGKCQVISFQCTSAPCNLEEHLSSWPPMRACALSANPTQLFQRFASATK